MRECTSDVQLLLVSLRKRPTSEIRGPQTVGVIGQHNTAHEIPKIDVFISEQQITGILNGTVGATLQTWSMPFLLNHKSLGILIGTVGAVF